MKYVEWKKSYLSGLSEERKGFLSTLLPQVEQGYDTESLGDHLVEDEKELRKFLDDFYAPINEGDHEKFHQALKQASQKNLLPQYKEKAQPKIPGPLADIRFFKPVVEEDPKKELTELTDKVKELKVKAKIISAEQIPGLLASDPRPRMKGWKPSTTRRYFGNRNWIQASYAIPPGKTIRDFFSPRLTEADKPPMATIKSILEAKVTKKTTKLTQTTYSILMASDALQNTNFAVFTDAVMVMASQGNCQESSGRCLAPLEKYSSDKTQGPACAMSAVDATIVRRFFMEDCDMMLNWLDTYDKKRDHFDYQYGYLTPKAGQVKACVNLLELHGSEILMNIQQVRIDNAGSDDKQFMTQIPCFAFALGHYDLYAKQRTKDDKETMPKLCETLLTLQYQAVAQLAVIKSGVLNKRIPLVLTPIGGGAFDNSRQAIVKAIAQVKSIVEGADVDVVVSIYESREVSSYRQSIPFLKDAPALSHDQMSQLGSGASITAVPDSGCRIS